MSDEFLCGVCGSDLFMVASGDVTCINRCRFAEPTEEQYEKLVETRIKRIPHQLREFTKAMNEYRNDFPTPATPGSE